MKGVVVALEVNQAKRRSLSEQQLKAARKRLLQMHYEAKVGHIGGNLSSLDAMLLVFHEYMEDRGHFFLSKGHSAGALYVALWSIGRLTDDQLRLFHKDDTLLAGHPPAKGIPEIKFATGSLGHGFSLAAGTALGLRLRGESGHVYCLTSDGEWQEGSTWEALIFAIHHRLENLTVLVDHNGLQGFGTTAEVASMSPLWDRLRGFDACVRVVDGHDLAELRDCLDEPSTQLRIVFLDSIKGHGVPFMENRMEWHYLPLNAEQFGQAIASIETA